MGAKERHWSEAIARADAIARAWAVEGGGPWPRLQTTPDTVRARALGAMASARALFGEALELGLRWGPEGGRLGRLRGRLASQKGERDWERWASSPESACSRSGEGPARIAVGEAAAREAGLEAALGREKASALVFLHELGHCLSRMSGEEDIGGARARRALGDSASEAAASAAERIASARRGPRMQGDGGAAIALLRHARSETIADALAIGMSDRLSREDAELFAPGPEALEALARAREGAEPWEPAAIRGRAAALRERLAGRSFARAGFGEILLAADQAAARGARRAIIRSPGWMGAALAEAAGRSGERRASPEELLAEIERIEREEGDCLA